jgi:hypothetical protein
MLQQATTKEDLDMRFEFSDEEPAVFKCMLAGGHGGASVDGADPSLRFNRSTFDLS